MNKIALTAVIALLALLSLIFVPNIVQKKITIIPIPEEPALPALSYEFRAVESYANLSLHQSIIDNISANSYTKWSLFLFPAKYTMEKINDSDYLHLKAGTWDELLDLDEQSKDTLARFYISPQNQTINFSQYPYGVQHFLDSAPKEVTPAIKERAASVLQDAGINRRELIQGVLALPQEEQLLGWHFLANLEDQGFSTQSGYFLPDMSIMDAQTVYENVHYTYLAWKLFPWAQELSFDDLVTYILPHRNGKEPLQRWRKIFFDSLAPAVITMKDPYQVGQFLVNISQRLIVYNGNTFWEDQGPLTLLQTHQGRSGEMAVLGTSLFRAVGIPAGPLIMSWWPRADGNHGFNYAIVSINGSSFLVQFDQVWNNTAVGNRTAKTYLSQTFGTSVDVTPIVTSTADITINIKKPFIDAYLNIFNYGSWVSLMQSESDADGDVIFDDVGNERNYLFAVSYDPLSFEDNGRLLAIPPFIVEEKTSRIHFFAFEDPFAVEREGKLTVTFKNLEPYIRHDLYAYSTEGFVRVESFFPTSTGEITLNIGKEGRLYLLKDADGLMEGDYARPFVIRDGAPEFY